MKLKLCLLAMIGLAAGLLVRPADDFTATRATVALDRKVNIERVSFDFNSKGVSTVEVRFAVTVAVDGAETTSNVTTNWTRAKLMSAGFTNATQQLLTGTLEATGPKSFKAWALSEMGWK